MKFFCFYFPYSSSFPVEFLLLFTLKPTPFSVPGPLPYCETFFPALHSDAQQRCCLYWLAAAQKPQHKLSPLKVQSLWLRIYLLICVALVRSCPFWQTTAGGGPIVLLHIDDWIIDTTALHTLQYVALSLGEIGGRRWGTLSRLQCFLGSG